MACSPSINGTGEAVNFVEIFPDPTEEETTINCFPLASLLCDAVSVTRVTVNPSWTSRFCTATSPDVGVADVKNSACLCCAHITTGAKKHRRPTKSIFFIGFPSAGIEENELKSSRLPSFLGAARETIARTQTLSERNLPADASDVRNNKPAFSIRIMLG